MKLCKKCTKILEQTKEMNLSAGALFLEKNLCRVCHKVWCSFCSNLKCSLGDK